MSGNVIERAAEALHWYLCCERDDHDRDHFRRQAQHLASCGLLLRPEHERALDALQRVEALADAWTSGVELHHASELRAALAGPDTDIATCHCGRDGQGHLQRDISQEGT